MGTLLEERTRRRGKVWDGITATFFTPASAAATRHGVLVVWCVRLFLVLLLVAVLLRQLGVA